MRFITASQIFDGKQFLQKDTAIVVDEKNSFVETVSYASVDAGKLEKYDGIITPGFVNAHCHLELSHLYNLISQKTGFVGFAMELMSKRFSFSQEMIGEAMLIAEAQMWDNGIVAVGDISNTADSFPYKDQSEMIYHTFVELIALNPGLAEKVMMGGKELQMKIKNHSSSLAPHAPYSVSLELMREIAKAGKENLPLSIHNQESKAEKEFFETGTGRVLELYAHLNIDISYYKPSGKTSLQTYLPSLSSDRNLILVHNTFSNKADIEFARQLNKKLFWCLCPNANLYIENALPDVNLLRAQNCKIVMGTDSLASNHSLSVIDELNVLMREFDLMDTEEVLTWATSNGAEALEIQGRVGRFIKGKNAGLNLIRLENKQFSFERKLA